MQKNNHIHVEYLQKSGPTVYVLEKWESNIILDRPRSKNCGVL